MASDSNIYHNQKQKLNHLIELISNQEAKLNSLKALRKLAKEQTTVNVELKNKLETVNKSVGEKDEELRLALNRVDNLNRQLNNHRRSKTNNCNNGPTQLEEHDLKHVDTNQEQIHDNQAILPLQPESYLTKSSNNSIHSIQNHPSPAINKYTKQKLATSVCKSLAERRVSFDPLALLLDAALEGELDLVIKTSKQVPDLSASHDECVTALHNAVVAGHYEIAKYLIEAGCDINVQDSDGWTPLHCAASCNNTPLVKLLIENGALIYATTTSDHFTPAMKCEKNEEGFEECYSYLMYVQNNLGVVNGGVVYALYDYDAQEPDELSFITNEELIVLRRDDSQEQEWWWAQKRIQQTSDTVVDIKEGYIPRNLVGLYPRVKAFKRPSNVAPIIPIVEETSR